MTLNAISNKVLKRYILLLLLKIRTILLSYRQNKSNVYKVDGIIEIKILNYYTNLEDVILYE